MFCNIFSESSTGSWAELQLPYCPSMQGNFQKTCYKTYFSTCCPRLQMVFVSLQSFCKKFNTGDGIIGRLSCDGLYGPIQPIFPFSLLNLLQPLGTMSTQRCAFVFVGQILDVVRLSNQQCNGGGGGGGGGGGSEVSA